MRLSPREDKILTSLHSESIAVVSEAVVYTASFKLTGDNGLKYKFASDGNVKVKVELEVGSARPTTEGSADASWAVPETGGTIEASLANETQHFAPLNPPPVPYGRLKITGLGAPSANDASTVLTASAIRDEEL